MVLPGLLPEAKESPRAPPATPLELEAARAEAEAREAAAQVTKLTSAASFLRRVSTAAVKALDTHAGADSVSPDAFNTFFRDCMIPPPALKALYEEEGSRLRLFRMDVHANASRLISRSYLGCTHEFVGILNRLVARCVTGLHADARPLRQDNYGVYEFTAVCERRMTPEWDELQLSLRSSGLIETTVPHDHDAHPMRVTCCRGRVKYTRPIRLVRALQRFFDNETLVRYQVLIIPTLVCYCCVMCLTASTKVGTLALTIAPIMLFGLVIEMLVRVYAEGPNDFWLFHRLKHNEGSVQGSFRAEALRFDIVVTVCSMVAWAAWKLSQVGDGQGFAASSDRMFLAIPALRLLSTVDNTRGLVFGLLGSLPSFYSIVTLLMLIVFNYAIVGMWWFGGQLEQVPEEIYDIPADFTTLFNAVATLFQLMVGESWNDVLVAAIYARRSLLPMWYFCSYIVVVLLLLTNVLIGIICDKFSDMEETDKRLQHRIFRESAEIRNTAVRVLQRFFYRKFALKLWKRRHRLRSRPSHSALVSGSGSRRGAPLGASIGLETIADTEADGSGGDSVGGVDERDLDATGLHVVGASTSHLFDDEDGLAAALATGAVEAVRSSPGPGRGSPSAGVGGGGATR